MKKKWSRLKITVRGYKTWKPSMESIFSTSSFSKKGNSKSTFQGLIAISFFKESVLMI